MLIETPAPGQTTEPYRIFSGAVEAQRNEKAEDVADLLFPFGQILDGANAGDILNSNQPVDASATGKSHGNHGKTKPRQQWNLLIERKSVRFQEEIAKFLYASA